MAISEAEIRNRVLAQHPEITSQAPTVDNLQKMFEGTPYASAPEFKNILQNYLSSPVSSSGYGGGTANPQWSSDVKNTLDRYANTFTQMFKDKVGRDPTANEYDTFFKQVVATDQPWAAPTDFNRATEETKGTLADFFTTAAQEQAQKKAQEAAAAQVAPGSAFDQWANSYRNSISGVEQSLADFQSRLMEKIRPQLLTSLKAQGLLDTGALNTAFAGTAGDLTSAAQNYIAQARGGAEQ